MSEPLNNQMASQAPTSAIDVHTGFFPLAFLLLLFKPKVAINGGEYGPVGWGDTRIPVPPGRYQVDAWLPYLFLPEMGRNGTVVDVPPGAVVQVRWRAPWLIFLKGKVTVAGPYAFDAAAAPAVAPPSGMAPPPPAGLPTTASAAPAPPAAQPFAAPAPPVAQPAAAPPPPVAQPAAAPPPPVAQPAAAPPPPSQPPPPSPPTTGAF
jgi:hypothetical protein